MHCHWSALLFGSLLAQAQWWAVSPAWVGTWTENPEKSTIFIPGTLTVERGRGGAYSFVELDGRRTPLACTPKPTSRHSCLYLTSPQPAGEGGRKAGVEYKVNPQSTELEVDSWRIVPDGSRLTDTDHYSRSTPGTGFAGRWCKTRSTEAPTIYRVSLEGDRMTFSVPNGELNISFSVMEAQTARGAYVSLSSGRGNKYKLLGPSKLLEQSVVRGKVVAQSHIAVSPDGQTMTEDHTDTGASPNPLHIVYDRSR